MIIEYAEYSNKVLSIDQQNVSLVHATGMVQKIDILDGSMELEDSKSKNDYLVWTQKGNIFAAVDRFNIISFWNTLTGKLIYKKVLEGSSRI